jgi:ABC-type protease/lipase transport system fused ATPase/permease subunit
MHALLVLFVDAIDWTFLIGVAGCALVLVLTFIEDVRTVMGSRESLTQSTRSLRLNELKKRNSHQASV